MARAGKGDLDGALRDFDQALALNPRLVGALISRGLLLWLGRLPEAEADFARFRELGGRLKPGGDQLWCEAKERLKQK
ncbi:MAG: hypothetical protein MOB07_17730 [Acidobacteria bacterium]|nr:hypothetical protein [Acidobacteriota bacterium]